MPQRDAQGAQEAPARGLTVRGLGFAYRRKKRLFDGLNLELEPGNIYGLLGKNGVGKTSLLKIMLGLLTPQEGDCEFMGHSAQRRAAAALSQTFFVPEELYLPPMGMKEYIALFSGFYPRFDKEAMGAYLKEFELPEEGKLGALSYGQKKKFLIAFGLAANTGLLIFDEPTNGLDIPSKSQFRKLLASALTDERILIISTHQVRDMESIIDPIIILDAGKIIFQRSVADIGARLCVGIQAEEPELGKLIYAEKIAGGYSVLKRNPGAEDARVDLEVLFNAVVSGPEAVNAAFAQETRQGGME